MKMGKLFDLLQEINPARRMLGRTWIDPNRRERSIEALRQYRREYDDRLKRLASNEGDLRASQLGAFSSPHT
jgi:hypothetical protein